MARTFDSIDPGLPFYYAEEEHEKEMRKSNIAADLRQILVEARAVLNTCLAESENASITKSRVLRAKIEKITRAIGSGSGRQPIATAPKDRRILLWGRFWTDQQGWMAEPEVGRWSTERHRWEADFVVFGLRPVFWWPLPETPVRCASCGEPVEQEQSPADLREWLCDKCHAVATKMREDGKL